MKSDHRLFMHATLIIKGGRLLARGYNHGSIHSEEDALGEGYHSEYKGAVAVNLMVKRKNGNNGNSRPCKKCMNLLHEYKIRRVIYFDGNDFVEEVPKYEE